MIAFTHLVFGVAIGKLFDLRTGTVMIFAVLSDLDQIFVFASPLVRNGVLHSVIAGVFLSTCLLLGFDRPSTAKSGFAGYISHISLDLLCINGIMALYPLKNFYSLGLTTETDLLANFSVLSFSLLLLAFQDTIKNTISSKSFS